MDKESPWLFYLYKEIVFRKYLTSIVIVSFLFTGLGPIPQVHADQTVLGLPQPGTMINLSPAYMPVLIKGLKVHPENPILFDFIVDTGNDAMAINNRRYLQKESTKIIKYFLASLTIPENDLWVNLSPYEKDRIVPEPLGQTEMGRDMLAQDYILKQMTASLIYPEKNLGKEFWNKVYAKAQELYGSNNIPVNTFNKVWIVADKAKVYVNNNTAFIVGSHLKVMLEEDYLALQKHGNVVVGHAQPLPQTNDVHSLGSQIIRSIILPELEKEVNTGKNFSNLRQIFYSMILAAWYKKNLKEALLNHVYSNKSKINGVNVQDKDIKEKIYQEYLKAYKKGVFNYIKEDLQSNGQTLPRKYFSGGLKIGADNALIVVGRDDPDANSAMVDKGPGTLFSEKVEASSAMTNDTPKLSLEEKVAKAYQATTIKDFIDNIENDYLVNTEKRLKALSPYLEKTDPFFTTKIIEPEILTSEWSPKEEWLYNSKGEKYPVDILSVRSANNSARGVTKGGLRALLSHKPDENEMRQANDLMKDPPFVKAFNYLNSLLQASSEDVETKKSYVKKFLKKWMEGEAKALSIGMSLKTSLLGLPLGGGKGVFFVGQIRENEDKTFSIEDPEIWNHRKNKDKPSPEDEVSFEFQQSEFKEGQASKLVEEITKIYPSIKIQPGKEPLVWLNDLLRSYLFRVQLDPQNSPKTIEETRIKLEQKIQSVPKKQDRDNRNIAKISRAYVRLLNQYGRIGPDTDVPAPDKGTDGTSMGFATDEYILLHMDQDTQKRDPILYGRLKQRLEQVKAFNDGIYPETSTALVEEASKYLHEKKDKLIGVPELAVFTGKKLNQGGVEGRTEATGFGVESMIDSLLEASNFKEEMGPDHKVSLAIQGAGNVALYLALKAVINGKIVKVLGDEGVTLIKEKGFERKEIEQLIERFEVKKQKMNEIWKEVIKDQTEVKAIYGEGTKEQKAEQRLNAILEANVDVLCPCASDGVIIGGEKGNANKIRARFIVSGANGPITADALEELILKKKIVLPDTLANAGGVMVSYFEQVQAKTGHIFSKEEVAEIGDQIHKAAFAEVWEESKKGNVSISLTEAADIVAAQGIIRAQYLTLIKKFNGDLTKINAERKNGETEAQLEKQIKASGLSAHLAAIQKSSLDIIVDSGDQHELIKQAKDANIIIAANTASQGAAPVFTSQMMQQIGKGKILVGPVFESNGLYLNTNPIDIANDDDSPRPIKMHDGNLSINYLHPTSQFRSVASQRLAQATQLLTEELARGEYTGTDESGVRSGIVAYNGHTITKLNPISDDDFKTIMTSSTGKKRTIGIPTEIFAAENRVGATPAEVYQLVKKGYTVLVEYGAGGKSNISNEQYIKAGAQMVSPRDVWQADVIRKVRPPFKKEFNYLKEGKIIESFFFLNHSDSDELKDILATNKVTAIAYEKVKKKGYQPAQDRVFNLRGVDAENDRRENYILDPMARVAGSTYALLAALYYRANNNYGDLTGPDGKITDGVIKERKNHLKEILVYIQKHLQAFKNHSFSFPERELNNAGIKDGIDGNALILGMDNNLSARAAALDLLLLKTKRVTIVVKSQKDKELLEEQFRLDGLLRQKPSPAQVIPTPIADKAAIVKNPGGINLNPSNMQMDTEGEKLNLTFDHAMLQNFTSNDFSGISPIIIRITRITSPWQI